MSKTPEKNQDNSTAAPDSPATQPTFKPPIRIAIVGHTSGKPEPIRVGHYGERPVIPAKQSSMHYYMPDPGLDLVQRSNPQEGPSSQQGPSPGLGPNLQQNSDSQQGSDPQQNQDPQQKPDEPRTPHRWHRHIVTKKAKVVAGGNDASERK